MNWDDPQELHAYLWIRDIPRWPKPPKPHLYLRHGRWHYLRESDLGSIEGPNARWIQNFINEGPNARWIQNFINEGPNARWIQNFIKAEERLS